MKITPVIIDLSLKSLKMLSACELKMQDTDSMVPNQRFNSPQKLGEVIKTMFYDHLYTIMFQYIP